MESNPILKLGLFLIFFLMGATIPFREGLIKSHSLTRQDKGQLKLVVLLLLGSPNFLVRVLDSEKGLYQSPSL
jgi:hypothetical protein